MSTEPSKPDPPKRRRRWFQFSLRTLLIFTVVCAIAAGWLGKKIERRRKERETADAIVKLGGRVKYDYERAAVPRSGPDWLRKFVGANFFNEVELVDLHFTNVTDAQLEDLQGLTQLQRLDLTGTNVSDAGLANLKGLTQLQELYLANTKVTDAGLVNIKGLTTLPYLDLSGTKVTDAGLENLKGLSKLQRLDLSATRVTDVGVNKLQKSLQKCSFDR